MSRTKEKKREARGPDIQDRVRAARCWLDGERNPRTGENNKDMEMAAFMSIFHPEIKGKRLKALLKTPASKERK